jgi:hypothetical protein
MAVLQRTTFTRRKDCSTLGQEPPPGLVFLHFLSVYGGSGGNPSKGETFEFRLSDTLRQIEQATCMPIVEDAPTYLIDVMRELGQIQPA